MSMAIDVDLEKLRQACLSEDGALSIRATKGFFRPRFLTWLTIKSCAHAGGREQNISRACRYSCEFGTCGTKPNCSITAPQNSERLMQSNIVPGSVFFLLDIASLKVLRVPSSRIAIMPIVGSTDRTAETAFSSVVTIKIRSSTRP